MTTRIDAINAGLRLIGEPRIAAEDGSTKAAREASAAFDQVAASVLRMHPWNFAMKRASVPKSLIAPAWGYSGAFPLPADCLRVWAVDALDWREWRVESGEAYGAKLALLCNEAGPVKIKYIADVPDISAWDALAVRVLAAALALDLCEVISEKGSLKQEVAALLDARLRDAKVADAIENPPTIIEPDDWEKARL